MGKRNIFEKIEVVGALRATLFLRVFSVVIVLIALPARDTIPLWMANWFRAVAYPLLFYNLLFLIFHKKISVFLQKYASVLLLDLTIAGGIVLIGGGWRSSYFEYTLTTIILFTIFFRTRGAFFSSCILALVAVMKDPTGGNPTLDVFDVSGWDMRLGAALFYISAGLILGYVSILIGRLQTVSKEKIEETHKRAVVEEQMRLALNLHDSLKSKILAILLLVRPLIKRARSLDKGIETEIQKIWVWLNYVQNELNRLVNALGSEDQMETSEFRINALVEEEIKIIEDMTGFTWHRSYDPAEIYAPIAMKQTLSRFLSEALMNAWRHSGKTSGAIEVGCSDNVVTIVIADTGRGFEYSEKKGSQTAGLKSLEQRALDLHGHLSVETAPARGCKVVLTFPLVKSREKLLEKA